ncbi:response regulator [bacterium]|nr:response regulator [bacterium]MCI0679956.1 response regulator [bacterium]
MEEKEKESKKEKGISVFIVDDDTLLLDMYATKFRERGFTVESFTDSNDALDKMRDGNNPDVLITDLLMPGLDGFGLIRKMRDENISQKTLIVILSNVGQRAEMDKAEELGVDTFLIKADNTPSEAVDKIEKILKKKK